MKNFSNKNKAANFFNNIENFKHIHNDLGIDTIFLKIQESEVIFSFKNLEKKLGFMLWEKPENIDVLRIKGIVNISDEENIFSLQG